MIEVPTARYECPGCGGHGAEECPTCKGARFVPLDRCPNATVPPIYRSVVDLASWAGEGVLPEAGGLLDQSPWFLAAVAFVQRAVSPEERTDGG